MKKKPFLKYIKYIYKHMHITDCIILWKSLHLLVVLFSYSTLPCCYPWRKGFLKDPSLSGIISNKWMTTCFSFFLNRSYKVGVYTWKRETIVKLRKSITLLIIMYLCINCCCHEGGLSRSVILIEIICRMFCLTIIQTN